VSCNTAVENAAGFAKSPHAHRLAVCGGFDDGGHGWRGKTRVGYEANGGFLLNSDIEINGKNLRALPTRDAVICHAWHFAAGESEGQNYFRTGGDLPARFTASDRLKNFATEKSTAILAKFNSDSEATDKTAIEKMFAGFAARWPA